MPLDTFAQLEPDDRHLEALAADASRPRKLADVLRAPQSQRFVHEFSIFEQTHTSKDKRHPRGLCSKWIIFRGVIGAESGVCGGVAFEPTDLRARRTLPSAGGAQVQTRHRLYMDGPRELDARHAAGINVQLLWDPGTQGLSVVAHDATSDETVTIYVEGHQALEVFRHPFAYAGEPAPRADLRVKA